ncbi:hypothetical protein IFM89_018913 [Coptis chinensis]|uniref:F-box/kelch-repeat protein n=1 Tax=Coptis chinensis TaxID=261450 RepID=A0A835HFR4_9MAGN|nr:hypothetical protein IFM89_018913 [Coptis chinensis]
MSRSNVLRSSPLAYMMLTLGLKSWKSSSEAKLEFLMSQFADVRVNRIRSFPFGLEIFGIHQIGKRRAGGEFCVCGGQWGDYCGQRGLDMLCLGQIGSRMSSVERYDVEKNEWVEMDGLPRVVGSGEIENMWGRRRGRRLGNVVVLDGEDGEEPGIFMLDGADIFRLGRWVLHNIPIEGDCVECAVLSCLWRLVMGIWAKELLGIETPLLV